MIRRTVEELIAKCKDMVEAEGERIDEEEYVNDSDPSILRFLLASREEVSWCSLSLFYFYFLLVLIRIHIYRGSS